MLFAVAYLYERFPRYDSVKPDRQVLKYYYKDVEVYSIDYSKFPPDQFVQINFPKSLVIEFIEAQSPEEALKKVVEKFPFHILITAVSAVPEIKSGSWVM